MPFTFSHPAIVLPFLKIRHASVSMSGLIIGSMTPDFEYFIQMKLSGRYSHSLEGMFFFDLPVACILALIFHMVVKKPFIDNLPGYFSSRLSELRNFDFMSYLRQYFLFFLICLLIGIALHIVWDSFTHANSYFVDRIPFLSTPIFIDGMAHLPLFRYLQHGSTIIGAGFIIASFHRQRTVERTNKPFIKFWTILFVVAVAAFTIRASFGFEYFGDIVTVVISSGIIGLIVSSIFNQSFSIGKNKG
jgi:hypothetical protein